jgi:hypothetical protein
MEKIFTATGDRILFDCNVTSIGIHCSILKDAKVAGCNPGAAAHLLSEMLIPCDRYSRFIFLGHIKSLPVGKTPVPVMAAHRENQSQQATAAKPFTFLWKAGKNEFENRLALPV